MIEVIYNMRTLRIGMRGTDVMEIQSLLSILGYYKGALDRVFGPQMRNAVIAFQRNFGLTSDGVIGPGTYKVIEKYLLGYDTYSIKPGDTFYKISQRYFTSLPRILAANPNLDPTRLQVGQQIIIPYGIDVVQTNIDYTYEIMERDIRGLKVRYPFLQTGVAGKSVLGKNLYYIRLGKGTNEVFYNGGHHALEWITAPLLMKYLENFSKAYVDGTNIKGYNPREIFNKSSITIIPMVNPDGVNLVLDGLSRDNPYYSQLIRWNNGSTSFSRNWEANIKGVDLNHNYNALFYEYKEVAENMGITGPGPRRYPGPSPESEPESKAVADFTRIHNFRLILAYHSQGKVIYWNFRNMAPPEAKQIAQQFARASGYMLDVPTGAASYSGYKDWFIQTYRRPGYTIEVGRGTNPLPLSQFPQIYRDNEEILLLAAIV